MEGSRADKLAALSHLSITEIADTVPGSGLDRFTPTSDKPYFDWPEVTSLFPWIHAGSKAHRLWPIAESSTLLKRRWKMLLEAVPRERGSLLRETADRTASSKVSPLLTTGGKLTTLSNLDVKDPYEGIEQYGYRSFDRQWMLSDNRLADRPRFCLWRVRGRHQNYLTTLTSTKLGQGPALTVTPYVPDIDHFRGSYGAKNVMPLYRDPGGSEPNVADGLLAALSDRLGAAITAEELLAYVYALGATSAFSDRFNDELAEAAGPIHIPITADPALFGEAADLGRELLWWHTWGERFAPEPGARLTAGSAVEVAAVEGMPERFDYDPESETLTVGTGKFAPVSAQAWAFEVSGLRVLRSWLGYRMKNRKGRKSSPLDDIRPTRWTQTNELLLVLSIVEQTIKITPRAADLLDRVVDGPLIAASDLPSPTEANCKPPRL